MLNTLYSSFLRGSFGVQPVLAHLEDLIPQPHPTYLDQSSVATRPYIPAVIAFYLTAIHTFSASELRVHALNT